MRQTDLESRDMQLPDYAERQLERIFACYRFANAPKLQAFLRFIVSRTIEGREDTIKGYTIATEAFGRDETFDSQTDPIVRVQAAKLRNHLALYYSTEGKDDPLKITIPNGRYVPRFEVSKPAPGPVRLPSCADIESEESIDLPVIALFPSEPQYAAPWQEGFCEGLAEELVNALDKFEEVQVLPNCVVADAMRTNCCAQDCGVKIGADFMVETHFFSCDSCTRLIVKLIGPRTGRCIWSRAYDLDLTPSNKVKLQQSTAETIAGEVAQPFGYSHRETIRKSRTMILDSLAAYECIVQSHAYFALSNDQTFDRALASARRATHLVPDEALAWATVSELCSEGYRVGFGGAAASDALLSESEECARKAVMCNPDSAYAKMAVADVHFSRGQIERARAVGEDAMTRNPSNHAMKARYGMCLAYAGEWNAGTGHIREALDQSSALTPYYHNLAEAAFRESDYQTALDYVENANPSFPFYDNLMKAMCFAEIGKEDQARCALSKMWEIWPSMSADDVEAILRRDYDDDHVARCMDRLGQAGLRL